MTRESGKPAGKPGKFGKGKNGADRRGRVNPALGRPMTPLESLMLNGPVTEAEERVFDIVVSERAYQVSRGRFSVGFEVSSDKFEEFWFGGEEEDEPDEDWLRKTESRQREAKKRKQGKG